MNTIAGDFHISNIRKYGKGPYRTALLHGGPGVPGEMRPVALHLSDHLGVLELLQTEDSVEGQIHELHRQLTLAAELPATLVGYSWGAWLAFLFAGKYPDLIRKLVLISSGAFENRFNKDLVKIRMGRLRPHDREEAEKLITQVNSGQGSNKLLRSLGDLMAMADSYDYEPGENDMVKADIQVYLRVWKEASTLRDTHKLVAAASGIRCPVVAIHGDHDPHPAKGVEVPLSDRLNDFRMILIRQCGHIPWKERKARDTFYQVLLREIA